MDEDDWLAAQAERTPSPEPDDDFFAEFEPRGLLEGEHTDEPVPATSSASQPAPTPAPVREQGKLSSCAIQGADSWIPDENDTLGGGDHEDDFFADNAKMDEIFGAALEDTGLLGESTGEPAPQAADSVMPFAPDPGQGVSSLPASDTRSDAALAASLAREIDESQRDLGNALAQLGTSSMGGDDHASGSALPESETPAIPAASNYSFQYGRRDDRGIPKYLLVASSVAFTFDGSEVKLPRRRRMKGWRAPKTHYDLDAGDGKIDHRTGAVQLTAQPVYQMMDNVRRRKAEAKRRAEDALAAEPQRAVLQDIQDMDRPVPMSRSAKLPQAQAAEAQLRSKLWVDKHCPSTFAHLLGEERIHRAVLGWIKAWDPCVFKTTPPPVEANPDTPWDKPDPLHRPREKVLLLSGPAGAGKTTLAHVLAKQAGYDVFEMNASDARSASSVDEVLRQALDAGSSVRGGKPTLVVLDEIDGATGGSGDGASFIRSLMRLIERGSLPPRSKKGRKGGKQPLVLQRPIICICNDLYAPSLRTLRPLAKVLRVPVPPFKTVVQRLRQVSSLEGLPTDNKGLTLLTELTGGDLRSCLNALQLLAVQHGQTASEQGSRNQRARRGITEESLRSAALGIKDGGSSLPRVWDVLLRARDSRKLQALSAAALLAPEAPGRAQSDTWLMAVVHELQLSGEYDKINTGLASAWPSFLATAKDDGWERAVKALDWLSFGETLSLSMRGGSFEMLPYCPYAIAPWHGLFAHYRIPLPDYPRQDFEVRLCSRLPSLCTDLAPMQARQRTQAFQEIVQSVQDALPPHFRATFDADRVATELGPMLTKIVNPLIKPVRYLLHIACAGLTFSLRSTP